MADVKLLAPLILKWEGGFQQMPEDKGNYLNGKLIGTNMGVTPAVYKAAFLKEPTVADMKALTKDQFTQVLEKLFWDRWRADEIKDQRLANLVVDWLWGSGAYGIKIPQRILKLPEDGIVGPKTIAAVNAADPEDLHQKIYAARIRFLNDIVIANPVQKKFIRGWLNRLADFK